MENQAVTERQFTALGLVKDIIGTNGAMAYTKENLANLNAKRLVISVRNDLGKEIEAFLSPSLTQAIRAREIGMGHLGFMHLSQGDNGSFNIHRPRSQKVWIEAKDLNIRELVPVALEDTIAI